MQEKTIICTVCPTGCTITLQGEGDTIALLEGYACNRGKVYATEEFTAPTRLLTSSVKVAGAAAPLVPVRLDKPIPKELLLPCMEVLKKLEVHAPVHTYDVLARDVLGTGADLVATGSA